MPLRFTADSEAENPAIARALLAAAGARRFFAFNGDLGAGKTTFIKSLCAVLGVSGDVVSPTFAIINEYGLPDGRPLYHFDFYRIRDEREAYDIGTDEYFDSGAYCFVEWAERIPGLVPPDAVYVHITAGENGGRLLEVEIG